MMTQNYLIEMGVKKSKNEKWKIYAHQGQKKFLTQKQRFRALVAGRMYGKSTIIGFSIYDKVKHLPGSRGLITCQTKKQFKDLILPSLKKVWSSIGLVEDFHYVCFKKPPENLEFKRPVAGWPDDWKDIIMFCNGTIAQLVSSRQYDSVRGGSFDWAEIDEAGFFPEDFFTKIIMWSIRGNKNVWNPHPSFRQVSIYTSMPWRKDRQWAVHMEDKAAMDPSLFYYQEGTSYDNPAALEGDDIDKLKKSMGYLEFMVECMNMRINFTEKPFYHEAEEEKHTTTKSIYETNQPIDFSIDPGAWFTACTAWQDRDLTDMCLKTFYQKKGSPKALVALICEHYKDHQEKTCFIYGDPRGNNETALGTTFFQEIDNEFTSRGWDCNVMVDAYRTESHEDRHVEMNHVLSETDDHLPRIRFLMPYTKDAMISMKITEATPDFKKNKKDESNSAFPQEHAPHYSDTVDYRYLQKHGWMLGLGEEDTPSFVD